jgi:AcrR family transcriptional regulator
VATTGQADTRQARASRREQLLDAAERAVRAHGAEVSMEAIAAEAGITKPVLYRHFGDRDGLLAALAARHAATVVADLRRPLVGADSPRARIRSTVDTYLRHLEQDPELHQVLTRVVPRARTDAAAALAGALSEVCDAVVASVEQHLRDAGLDTTPARTWGEGMVGMVQLVGDRWLERQDLARDELVGQLTELLWSGFRGLAQAR